MNQEENINETNVKNLIDNLNEAQKLAQIGHWELDLTTNSLFWSDEVFRIFGLEPQEFEATYEAFLEHIHPDDHELVNHTYLESIKNKSAYRIRHRVITKDNQLKHVEERCIHKYDDNGDIVKSIGTIHDLTKQVKNEAELNIASNVFRYSNDGIVITDKNNTIISINKAFEKHVG
jgi:PAS domain S-box-containing protein